MLLGLNTSRAGTQCLSVSSFGGSTRVFWRGGRGDDRGRREMRTISVGLQNPAKVREPEARRQSLQWQMAMKGRRTALAEYGWYGRSARGGILIW